MLVCSLLMMSWEKKKKVYDIMDNCATHAGFLDDIKDTDVSVSVDS